MGCSDSKLNRLPAVVLCRDRCKFLDHALHHADALSRAHTAYAHSLSSFGDALLRCTDPNLPPHGPDSPPVVNREQQKIGSPSKSVPILSRSASTDSHIKFNSDESSGKIKSESFNNNQLVPYNYDFESPEESLKSFFEKFTINYMKAEPMQSQLVTYARPVYDHNYYDINEVSQTDSSWNLMNFFDPYDLPLRTSSRREIRALTRIGESFRRYEQKQASESVGGERQSLLRNASETEREIKKESEKSTEAQNDNSKRSVVSEVVREVNALFQKASASGDAVFKMLGDDDERVRYTNNGSQEYAWQPYSSETARFLESKPMNGGSNATMMSMENSNLRSTLKKLCMWEKKLHREVKAEEKLRVFHARKWRELKKLVEKGADPNKIDSSRSLIGSLSTTLKISIHAIAKISTKINKLRDDELSPLITDFILRLSEMWKTMLECHRRQLSAIKDAKVLDSVEGKLESDAAVEGFLQIRLELHRWNLNFLRWVDSQKCFARSLNDWLLRCLTHESDAAAKTLKSSHAMRGAPPVFSICNEWVQTLEGSIKEKDVMESMEVLHVYLKQITSDRISVYLQPTKPGDSKEMEKKVRMFMKEDQKIHRAMKEIDKKVHKYSITRKHIGLQTGLEHVLQAVERVALHSMEAYDELCSRINNAKEVQ